MRWGKDAPILIIAAAHGNTGRASLTQRQGQTSLSVVWNSPPVGLPSMNREGISAEQYRSGFIPTTPVVPLPCALRVRIIDAVPCMNRGGVCAGRHEYIPVGSPPPTHAFRGSFNYRPSINAVSLLVSFALTLALSGKRERRLFGALSSSAVQGRAGAARQCHVEAWPSRQGAWRRLGGRPSELGRPASVALDFLEDRIVGARSAGGGASPIPGPVAQFLDLLAHGSGQRHDLSGVLYHVLGSE